MSRYAREERRRVRKRSLEERKESNLPQKEVEIIPKSAEDQEWKHGDLICQYESAGLLYQY